MTRPRVIHVTTTDISLALLLGPQLVAFEESGYEVIGASAPGEWTERVRSLGIEHVPLRHATRSWAPIEDARELVELWRLFRRLRPAIVHTHNPKPGIYGRVAARLARVPVVVNTVHGLYAVPEDPLRKRVPVYALERLAATCSDVELVQGPEDLETLASIGIPRHKLVRLGNGIDLGRFDPSAVGAEVRRGVRAEMGADDATVVCGVVGRLVREKGLDEVVAAARRLRDTAPSARVVIIGIADPDKVDGFGPAEIELAARDAGVRFLGARDDMPACYAAMDLLVFPSHREGFPRAPMEAAAMGRPVVASDVRGCREVVDHGMTGLLVPVRDAGALAAAVERLVRDADLRRTMGDAARTKARREFDDRRVVEITLRAYRGALARCGRVAPGALATCGPIAVRLGTVRDAHAAARLHASELPDAFLVSLGRPFLERLYRRIALRRDAFLLVAERDGEIVGMSAAAASMPRLYRAFALRDGVVAGLRSAPTVVRSWRRVLETARYGRATHADLPNAELLSLAVDPAARGLGVGRALAATVVRELEARGIDSARVVVRGGNEPALAAYRAAGFAPAASVEVHDGIVQEVLVWG